MDARTIRARFQPSIRSFFLPGQSTPKDTRASTPASNGISQSPTSKCKGNLENSTQENTLSGLPAQATIANITLSLIQPLRRINALLLPVAYPDSFYQKIISPDSPISFSRAILWSDPEPKVVGGIVCRLEVSSDLKSLEGELQVEGIKDVYIQSLALLSPYRRKGLAREALRILIQLAIRHQELNIRSFYAHVWTENKEALKWYLSQGFQREDHIISGYYRRLKPDTAFVLRRRLTPTDFLESMPLSPTEKDNKFIKQTKISQVKFYPHLKPPESTRSFQEKGPDQEWNDLPQDVISHPSAKSCKNPARSEMNVRVEAGNKLRKKRVYPTTASAS